MKPKHYIAFIVATFLLVSCNLFKEEDQGSPVARVNEQFLYEKDIRLVIPENLSAEDSLARVNNYITQWATQKLLMDGALINLSTEKQSEFTELVKQYRQDLYTKAYLEALVKQNIDTLISDEEATQVYEQNKETFKLNDELIQFRYANVDLSNSEIDSVEERLKRYNEEDKRILDSLSIQFRSYSLNDSIWIKVSQAIEKIPVITVENRDQLLKKTNFIQLEDSLGLYLMYIKDVRLRNEIAPMEYVLPTIRQIVINKRKLEFIKQLEKDITKDAIRNGQFEIYD